MRRSVATAALAVVVTLATGTAASAFGEGTFVIGQDISPGRYEATGGESCYWARLSGFGGTTDEIIANGNPSGPVVVTILASDAGFETQGCGEWMAPIGGSPTPLPSASLAPSVSFGDGTYLVGEDVPAGTYRSEGGEGCYWARLSGFGGTLEEIIANDNPTGPAVVTIDPSDAGFQTRACSDWVGLTSAGPAPSLSPSASTEPTSGLHGSDLITFEVRMPGELGVALATFIKGWNREVTDYEKSLVLPKKLKIENDDGVRTFQHNFKVRGFMGGRIDNLGLLGRLDGADLEMIALLWYRMPDELMDGLNAVIAMTSLPHAVDPGVSQDEVNLLFEDLELPDDDFTGYEAQAVLRGIQYTIADNGEGSTAMVARRISNE